MDASEFQAFLSAIEANQLEMVQTLAASAPELVVRRDERQRTACFHAKTPRMVNLLVSLGADVNAQDEIGCSPLYWSLYSGLNELAHALIDAGSRHDVVSEEGDSALHVAAREGNREMVTLLCDRGWPLEARNGMQWTALHEAVFCNASGIISDLLSRGANPNAIGQAGFTPLLLAVGNDDLEIARILRDAGAEVHHSDNDGLTIREHCRSFEMRELLH